MTPSSEELESFLERLQALDRALSGLGGAEVRETSTISEIKTAVKEWLRMSEALRSAESVPPDGLELIDSQMKQILQSTNARTRSSSFRKKFRPVLAAFTDRIVIPIIRFEGSPSQVASRQLMAEFNGRVTTEERGYLEESARCLASRCNRAAIIMLWASAMARFHGAIEKVGFNVFNAARDKVAQKKGTPYNKVSTSRADSLPELQRCRDFDVIVVGMELWKYDLQAFEELDRLLGIRNSAAHPGMLKPSAIDVQQYASKVATYVYDVVPI